MKNDIKPINVIPLKWTHCISRKMCTAKQQYLLVIYWSEMSQISGDPL